MRNIINSDIKITKTISHLCIKCEVQAETITKSNLSSILRPNQYYLSNNFKSWRLLRPYHSMNNLV